MSQKPEPAFSKLAELDSEYKAFVDQNLKRNFIANFMHGMLGMTGFRLIYAPTFVPAYLALLTDSAFMVGLGVAMLTAGAIVSPIFGATQIEHLKRVMPKAVRIGTMMRVQMLGLALAGWFMEGNWRIAATLFFLLMLGVYTGSQRVVFQFLMAKVIPVTMRGRLQATRNLIGGAIAAVLSYWAGKHLIEANVFGNGYATTFMLSFVLTSMGLTLLYLLIKEPEGVRVRKASSVRQRLREMPLLIKDLNFRNFLVVQLAATAGRIAIPFCVIYAATKVEMSGEFLGLLTLAFLGADTVSNLIWGVFGDRKGFLIILVISILIWIASLLVILFSIEPWHFLVGYGGLGAARCAYMMATTTMVLEFGDTEDVPMRLACSTSVETTMATLAPLIGGVIAASFGFTPVFVLSILCLVLALVILVFGVRDPRSETLSLK